MEIRTGDFIYNKEKKEFFIIGRGIRDYFGYLVGFETSQYRGGRLFIPFGTVPTVISDNLGYVKCSYTKLQREYYKCSFDMLPPPTIF